MHLDVASNVLASVSACEGPCSKPGGFLVACCLIYTDAPVRARETPDVHRGGPARAESVLDSGGRLPGGAPRMVR